MSLALPARESAELRDRVARLRLADELAEEPRRSRPRLPGAPGPRSTSARTKRRPSAAASPVPRVPPAAIPKRVRPPASVAGFRRLPSWSAPAAASISALAAKQYRRGELELELAALEPAARARAERLLAVIPAESIGRVDQACRVALLLEQLGR